MTGMYGSHVREAFVGLWNFVGANTFDSMVIMFAVYGAYALYREFFLKKKPVPPV